MHNHGLESLKQPLHELQFAENVKDHLIAETDEKPGTPIGNSHALLQDNIARLRSTIRSSERTAAMRAAEMNRQARLARIDRIVLQDREREGRHRLLTMEEDIFMDHLIPYYQLLLKKTQECRSPPLAPSLRSRRASSETRTSAQSISSLWNCYPTLQVSAAGSPSGVASPTPAPAAQAMHGSRDASTRYAERGAVKSEEDSVQVTSSTSANGSVTMVEAAQNRQSISNSSAAYLMEAILTSEEKIADNDSLLFPAGAYDDQKPTTPPSPAVPINATTDLLSPPVAHNSAIFPEPSKPRLNFAAITTRAFTKTAEMMWLEMYHHGEDTPPASARTLAPREEGGYTGDVCSLQMPAAKTSDLRSASKPAPSCDGDEEELQLHDDGSCRDEPLPAPRSFRSCSSVVSVESEMSVLNSFSFCSEDQEVAEGHHSNDNACKGENGLLPLSENYERHRDASQTHAKRDAAAPSDNTTVGPVTPADADRQHSVFENAEEASAQADLDVSPLLTAEPNRVSDVGSARDLSADFADTCEDVQQQHEQHVPLTHSTFPLPVQRPETSESVTRIQNDSPPLPSRDVCYADSSSVDCEEREAAPPIAATQDAIDTAMRFARHHTARYADNGDSARVEQVQRASHLKEQNKEVVEKAEGAAMLYLNAEQTPRRPSISSGSTAVLSPYPTPRFVGSLSVVQAEESIKRAQICATEYYEWSEYLLPMQHRGEAHSCLS